ncbi:glycoside hydrolase family 15 protein [Halalkalicoccus tibetensis]|uniref:Glycoside hydrolase family 15 protein n=1 Tax=Halalkalicoccus tibetensis TaxID=175632 RepID=A0ABD5V4R7_9EURY
MTLRAALADYLANEGHPTRFPGERRTTEGLFSGLDDRLVHVAPDGALRDHTDSLAPLSGLDRATFGIGHDDGITWFDELETLSQGYVGDTALVETRLSGAGFEVTKYDLTVGRAHLTHVECEDGEGLSLHALATFAPEGRDSRLGKLVHEDAVEVYHRREHDYLGAAAGEYGTRPPIAFDAVLRGEAPRELDGDDRYENDRLGGTALARAPLGNGTTVGTLLTDREETDRKAALETLSAFLESHGSPEELRESAEKQVAGSRPGIEGLPGSVADDLRVLDLLSAPTGARIAGPEFDPYSAYSGGYGYTWFRDDGEVSSFLLEADEGLGIDLSERHAASARFFCRTQREDGTWPHRVWSFDGSLAPGWANGRLEAGDGTAYQADQTGSVVAFLAAYLREGEVSPELADEIRDTLGAALEGLDDSLAEDGLPEPCQNAWEDMEGRFSNTAATFLEAYAALARAPLDGSVTDRAAEQAARVYGAIDELWSAERGAYALRLRGGELDDRLDSSALALVGAHEAYAEVATVDDERLDRLATHAETLCEGLYRDPDSIAGLIRYEGDDWRTREQGAEKVWTVSTAWGAHANASLADLLAEYGREEGAARADERARELFSLIAPEGALCRGAYLPEQFFDDGTPDSATPLGWPHAIRLATIGRLGGNPAAGD